jgi:hypothetical protein
VLIQGVCAKPTTLTHPKLTVSKTQGSSVRQRSIYQLSGWSPPIEFGVHNSSINNLSRGLLERVYHVKKGGVFSPAPQPLVGIFKERLSYFKTLLVRRLGKSTPMSRQDFPSLYRGRRRTIYQNAVDSLEVQSIRRKDSYLKTFVKAEKINFTSKKDPVPRVIQPRDPRYNVEVGRYLKPLEPKIYSAVASIFDDVTIFKGLNSGRSGQCMRKKWLKYSNPVAVGLDASRFDQHVSVQALNWEHSIYLASFSRHSDELSRLLSWQVSNKGRGFCQDGKVKYSVEGCRMSGDMNTALGNCIIMCALVHAYCKERGIDRYSLANNGDDCVVIFERDQLEQFQIGLDDWFLEMGFNMKVEDPVFEFEQIDFCQTHPVLVQTPGGGQEYIMVRNVGVALAKDCISIKPFDCQSTFQSQMTAVGDCGIALTGGVPICQEFYRGLLRVGNGIKFKREQDTDGSGREMMRAGMSRTYQPVSQISRYSFWLAFGVIPDMQIELEKHYASLGAEWRGHVRTPPQFLPAWL